MNYASFVQSLSNFLVLPVADPNFIAAIPNIIDDAEQRIYRDLDLLNTVVVDGTATCNALNPGVVLPTPAGGGPFLVVQQTSVVTPLGANTLTGTSTLLLKMSKDMLAYLFPSSAGAGVPKYFAMISQNTVTLGPWPDAAYGVTVVGTVRPNPLSATNTTTLLTLYFPDLFLAAALAIGAGYLKNFGAATDDPQSGLTWESKYKTQLQSAVVEEARKKLNSALALKNKALES